MHPLVNVALLGWIGVAMAMFLMLPPRRAMLASVIAGFLLLPVPNESIGGFRWTKAHAIGCGTVLASLLLDSGRLFAVRPRWFDVPMLVWCVCPFLTSMANELGEWDGISQSLINVVQWGLPYWLGRAYLPDAAGLREAALALAIGAAVYVPLCVYEIRMSPQLHAMVWGYAQHDFLQTIRFGGYRPMVFLNHGLMLALWMAAGTLAAAWLWRTGAVRTLTLCPGFSPVPMALVTAGLAVTTLLTKSTGALALAAIAAVLLCMCRRPLIVVPMLTLLLAVGPAYVLSRASGVWTGESLVAWIAENFSADRAESLQFRFENENRILVTVHERPVLGWGGWGRGLQLDPETGKSVVLDGFWIITLNARGFLGLIAVMAVILLPALQFLRFHPPRTWMQPTVAPAAVIAVVLVIYLIDCLPNGMINPIFMVAGGGLIGLSAGSLRPLSPTELPPAPAPGRRRLPPPRRLERIRTPALRR